MPSFQLSITPAKRAGGRLVAKVRRELLKALAEQKKGRKLTQAEIARQLGVHRSVVNRQLVGVEDMTIGRAGEIAAVLGYEPDFVLRRHVVHPNTNGAPSTLTVQTTPAFRDAEKDGGKLAVVAA